MIPFRILHAFSWALCFLFLKTNKCFLCHTVSGITLPWFFWFRFWFMRFASSWPGTAVIWVQSSSVTGLEDQGPGSLARLLAGDPSSSPQSPLQRAPHATVPPAEWGPQDRERLRVKPQGAVLFCEATHFTAEQFHLLTKVSSYNFLPNPSSGQWRAGQ